MVGEAVQQCSGEPFRAKDLGPLVEGKVGGHQDGATLVALAEDLEEQFSRLWRTQEWCRTRAKGTQCTAELSTEQTRKPRT